MNINLDAKTLNASPSWNVHIHVLWLLHICIGKHCVTISENLHCVYRQSLSHTLPTTDHIVVYRDHPSL